MLKIERVNLGLAKTAIADAFKTTKPFQRGNWQGLDIANKPDMAVHELLHVSIDVDLSRNLPLEYYRSVLSPNLPWADNHFEERVCGQPINPGVEWANWPWGNSADGFRESGQFNHNYMERYWPRRAGMVTIPTLYPKDYADQLYAGEGLLIPEHRGIRGRYGDLNDVVAKLCLEPTTRQAILPIYFPEDTAVIRGRQPCSMYYHFLMDDKKRLDVVYPMRSCDFIRHWSDDVYLTIRLLLWVINQCKEDDKTRLPSARYWTDVVPGRFVMHIANLHMFRNDWLKMYGAKS